jgi:creatinine amidohydrolase
MLHLAPDLVRMELAERRVPEGLAVNQHVRFGGRVSFGWLSNDFYPEGYVGDPTSANAELGRTIFEGAVRGFGEALREISTFDFGR